ncbi:hypothetical protein J007_06916 [Cryptococcus neoformans]|nr:hypothetical protein J007_06916 [Cryptococcus neoformans var. grubii]OXC57542.1 hypothetical protein C358_07010 [Cryptococcus neoformans var. grubii MW-RSA852]
MAPCVCLTTLLSCSPRRCSLANLSAAPSSKHQHKHLSTARLIFDRLSCFTAVPHIAICLCWCASTGGRSYLLHLPRYPMPTKGFLLAYCRHGDQVMVRGMLCATHKPV